MRVAGKTDRLFSPAPEFKLCTGSRGGAAGQLLGHALDVPGLLAWCVALHDRAPRAATLSLPARDFSLGETLTPTADAGVAAAIAALTAIARG